jgi:Family of unknown function (DUF5947)
MPFQFSRDEFMAVASSPLSALRRFARPQPVVERCELCGAALLAEHQHLLELSNRRLACACDPCAILFDSGDNGRYRRVPRRIQLLSDFRLTDAQWESLHLPINLAFIYRSTPAKRVIAMYPSPAGATESLLSLESWDELVAENPILGSFEPDVEALLINRVGEAREYCRVPIDECFKLVGLIRTHWRGLSGGYTVWGEISKFFDELKKRGGSHA